MKKNYFITEGVYKYIRHPMNAAHLIWAIAQVLMLHNWIAGFSFFIVILPHYLLRVGNKERMMLNRFGEEYRVYMQKTGQLIPRWSLMGK